MVMEPSSGSSSNQGSASSSLPGWSEGQRVVDDESYRATVRYIGPVATAKDPESIWIGEYGVVVVVVVVVV